MSITINCVHFLVEFYDVVSATNKTWISSIRNTAITSNSIEIGFGATETPEGKDIFNVKKYILVVFTFLGLEDAINSI